jgi:hypothetical protein
VNPLKVFCCILVEAHQKIKLFAASLSGAYPQHLRHANTAYRRRTLSHLKAVEQNVHWNQKEDNNSMMRSITNQKPICVGYASWTNQSASYVARIINCNIAIFLNAVEQISQLIFRSKYNKTWNNGNIFAISIIFVNANSHEPVFGQIARGPTVVRFEISIRAV